MPYNVRMSEFVPSDPGEQDRINSFFRCIMYLEDMHAQLETMEPDFAQTDRIASQIALLNRVQFEQHEERTSSNITDKLYVVTAPQCIDVWHTWLRLGEPQKIDDQTSVSPLHVVIRGMNLMNKKETIQEICILGVPDTSNSRILTGPFTFDAAQKNLLIEQVSDLQELRNSRIIPGLDPGLDAISR